MALQHANTRRAIVLPRRPRVSVVLIFLDAERFLREAIESVLAQTFSAWELLLVDDGSTDGSSEIARCYAAEHPGAIRYLTHPGRENRGMSASRNLGIGAAAGEFVAFIDADDVYLPEKLERQSELLDATPEAAMVYGPTLHWYSWAGIEANTQLERPRKLGVAPNTLVPPAELVRRYLTSDGWPPATCAVLVRRTAVERVGGFEQQFRGLFEDQVFFYKLCLRFPVYVHAETWDLYRQHNESACEQARARGEWDPRPPNAAHREFVLWLQSHLIENGIHDHELWRSLRARLFPYRHPNLYRMTTLATRARGGLVATARDAPRLDPEASPT